MAVNGIPTPISYWKLDESSGNAADSVGSNTLTNTNSATYAAAKIKNGVSLTGANYLSIANASQTGLSFTTALTLACWIQPSSIGTFEGIIEKVTNTSVDFSYGLIIKDFSGSKLLNFTKSSTGTLANEYQAASTTVIGTGAFYHVAVTFDTTNGVRLFINGAQETLTNVVSQGGDTATTAVYSGLGPFQIGAEGGAIPFHGLIDEAGAWNVALTPTQIAYLWANGGARQYPFAQAGNNNVD